MSITNIHELIESIKPVITCAACGCIIERKSAIEIDGELYCTDCVETCNCCCELRPRTDMTNTEDGIVCEECLDTYYDYCNGCDTWRCRDDLNWSEREDCYVCDSCLASENHYFRCDHCGEIDSIEEAHQVWIDDDNSETWCASCYEGHSFYCEECGRAFDYSSVSEENGICEYCADGQAQRCGNIDSWCAPRGIRSYGYKPDPCFCPPEALNDICFGFELEMEDHRSNGCNVDTDADYMNDTLGFTYCKHDGSLTDGIELVSHPATLEYLMERKETFREVFDEMIRRGYTSHDNKHCGLHVHISLKPLLKANEDAVNNLLIIVDNLWGKFVRFSRRTEEQLNSWAARYNSKLHKPKDVAKGAKANCGRYTAVNQENKHTVEIRIFRGTLKVDTFFATLQLVQCMVDMSIACKDPEKAYDITWEQLIDCDYPELKAYCEKRFANTANDADNNESPAVQTGNFNLTHDQMHRANLRAEDPVKFIRTNFINECFIGVAGTIHHISPYQITTRISEKVGPLPAGSHVFTDVFAEGCIQRTSPLRVGDYVETTSYTSGILDRGEIGIVRHIDGSSIAVEFGHGFPYMHDCDGHVQSRKGRYFGEDNLRLI